MGRTFAYILSIIIIGFLSPGHVLHQLSNIMADTECQDSAALQLQKEAAKLLADVKCLYRTSQSALSRFVTGVDTLTDINLELLKDKLKEELGHEDGYLYLRQINEVLDSLKGQSFFQGLKTTKALDAYMAQRTTVDSEEKLMQVILDTHFIAKDGKPVSVPKDYGYYIPFLPQLEQLLNCPEVLNCVLNPKSTPGVYRSVTDGLSYKHHIVVKRYGNQVLAIIIYCDDVEFADPCKSKTKIHRLRLYYWSLGNIDPKFRSSLRSINLLAIVKSSLAKKYGNEPFLEDFVIDMIKLGTSGVKFSIFGKPHIFYGILLCSCGDMPAQANLGGYKETHFALRPCRHCMVTKFKLCDRFTENMAEIRTNANHKRYLEEIEKYEPPKKKRRVEVPLIEVTDEDNEPMEEDVVQDCSSKQYSDHVDPSINYGVNRGSILSLAPGWDNTKNYPIDIMHTLHEGIVNDLCRMLIKDLCYPQKDPAATVQPVAKCTLKFLNEAIRERCDFGHLNANKPSEIEKGQLGKKLRQSAAQMHLLAHILPFFTFNNLPQEKHDLLLKLLEIFDLTMLFEMTETDIVKLEKTVEEFGSNVVKIYPNFRTLKLHSLRHLGMTARLFGGFRQVWCFRYEAMHRLFTSLVDVVNNMKNISLTMASRYILRRDSEFLDGKDGKFLYQGDTFTGCKILQRNQVPESDLLILQSLFSLNDESVIKELKSMKKHASSWNEKSVFIESYNSDGNPLFGKAKKIYLVNDEVTLFYSTLTTKYVKEFNVYFIVSTCDHIIGKKFDDIPQPFPIARFNVNLRRKSISCLIVMRPMAVD